ncbi:hydroxyisourate hydrolase [Thalassotalea euphylliae]|uniref:5-hydroxyisourate hydrolase n=1 Tax=Thalassotalea euphylliae TaxID=1655234 RepID=A0A3E0TT06_9GAMM|nr:hydroxyisourate hydrolase [Thalassotalea euphylliae]REL27609.1 hydroxyisourate hydrolase [Thalassotalea euphylliae]
MSRSPITTHILDTSNGKPARNVPVTLLQLDENTQQWQSLCTANTDDDGRLIDWLPAELTITHGTYKLLFDIDAYHAQIQLNGRAFYPFAELCFRVLDDNHHHIPLLLSPFGYSTYRGS